MDSREKLKLVIIMSLVTGGVFNKEDMIDSVENMTIEKNISEKE